MNKFAVAFAVAISFASMSTAMAQSAETSITHVSVSMEQARKMALNQHAGEIVDEKVEVRAGGSGLRYTFRINTGETTYEVGIDANTGEVLIDGVEPVVELESGS